MPGRVRRFNSLCQCIKWHRRDHVRRPPNTSRGARFGPLRLVARAATGIRISPLRQRMIEDMTVRTHYGCGLIGEAL
jgi:hypothetical protein